MLLLSSSWLSNYFAIAIKMCLLKVLLLYKATLIYPRYLINYLTLTYLHTALQADALIAETKVKTAVRPTV